MHWHLQWQKLTPHLTTNTMGENATTLTRKLAKLRGRMACLPRYSCETCSNAFWTTSLVRTIVKKRKHLCDLVSHSNRITSEQSNPNYVTTFHVQPLKSLQSGTSVILPKMEALSQEREMWEIREGNEATLPGRIEPGLGSIHGTVWGDTCYFTTVLSNQNKYINQFKIRFVCIYIGQRNQTCIILQRF